ncbi:21792_t:CDS:2 [Dentiscutata erythropus]|uniref:21792_t:CDS:1 n=1 Tax=Dentiscutata erythropus TaxID=1348616 RepID=A0A9N9EF17_9GLOM|nr:21792_t:CDS:2 [Dentiscutata erythropus]
METFNGKVQTVNDAMIIFEACRRGILQRTTRRLLEKEKEELRSGQVYVFDEHESGIKRWTDGRLWSPSRIVKDFLVYRELATRDRSVKRDEPIDEILQRRVQAEGLKVHQCSKGTFILRNNGLLKKTISIKFNGTYQHMIIYEDGKENEKKLLPPQAFQELRSLQPEEDIVKAEKMPKVNRNSKKAKKKRRISKQLPYGPLFYPQSATDSVLLWNRHQDDYGNNNYAEHDYIDQSYSVGSHNSISPESSSTTTMNNYDPYNSVSHMISNTATKLSTPILFNPWSTLPATRITTQMHMFSSSLANHSSLLYSSPSISGNQQNNMLQDQNFPFISHELQFLNNNDSEITNNENLINNMYYYSTQENDINNEGRSNSSNSSEVTTWNQSTHCTANSKNDL